jgi:outer membrane immunogenic protein
MRKFVIPIILGSAVLAAGAPARAADMLLKAPPPAAPPPYDWSGFYGGVNVGADWGQSSITSTPGLPFPAFENTVPGFGIIITPGQFATLPSTSSTASTVLGGGQLGYNLQSGHVVYGLEADIDGTGLHEGSTSTLTRTTLSGTQTVTANFSANIDWIATIRGRLGYAVDRGMLYVTGGLAGAATSLNTVYAITEPLQPPGFGPFPGAASSSNVVWGWTVGAGGEWAFDRNWSAAAEYRHSDFGSPSYNIGFSDTSLIPFTTTMSASVHWTEDQVTARLNYHFH